MNDRAARLAESLVGTSDVPESTEEQRIFPISTSSLLAQVRPGTTSIFAARRYRGIDPVVIIKSRKLATTVRDRSADR